MNGVDKVLSKPTATFETQKQTLNTRTDSAKIPSQELWLTIRCSETIIFQGATTSGAKLEAAFQHFYETKLALKDIRADIPLSTVRSGILQVSN